MILMADARHIPLADESVDSIVTDPPYELGFMGKTWDKSGVAYSVDVWREALRVLKPGGHLLAFGGSRTYHRLACAIEDAGFEIRDQIMWIYGSGFPKSLDVSKAIDKAAGEYVPGEISPNSRASGTSPSGCYSEGVQSKRLSNPQTDSARQWSGWGTALKPAHEPIVVARKPLIGTIIANVLAHGTGALNIDECRVGIDPSIDDPRLGGKGDWSSDKMAKNVYEGGYAGERVGSSPLGRWPANVIHDGSEEVVGLFPITGPHNVRLSEYHDVPGATFSLGRSGIQPSGVSDNGGSAARFFYCAKASKEDRDWALRDGGVGALRDGDRNNTAHRRNHHPTVKPLALMRYLCRLVTPPGGIVLDPFAGSGSTLRGAFLEGFKPIGIELDAEYCRIARGRMNLLTPAMAGLML